MAIELIEIESCYNSLQICQSSSTSQEDRKTSKMHLDSASILLPAGMPVTTKSCLTGLRSLGSVETPDSICAFVGLRNCMKTLSRSLPRAMP